MVSFFSPPDHSFSSIKFCRRDTLPVLSKYKGKQTCRVSFGGRYKVPGIRMGFVWADLLLMFRLGRFPFVSVNTDKC